VPVRVEKSAPHQSDSAFSDGALVPYAALRQLADGVQALARHSDDRVDPSATSTASVGEAGLEFVAYDAHEVEVQRDNPFLSRTEMFRVMTRSMGLYRHRHAGRAPRRVMVHKTTEFKKDEIEGCLEALHLCEAVDLVQIVDDVSWRGALIDPGATKSEAKGSPSAYPVQRGTLLGLGPYEALL
jgi:hypothetical protein